MSQVKVWLEYVVNVLQRGNIGCLGDVRVAPLQNSLSVRVVSLRQLAGLDEQRSHPQPHHKGIEGKALYGGVSIDIGQPLQLPLRLGYGLDRLLVQIFHLIGHRQAQIGKQILVKPVNLLRVDIFVKEHIGCTEGPLHLLRQGKPNGIDHYVYSGGRGLPDLLHNSPAGQHHPHRYAGVGEHPV